LNAAIGGGGIVREAMEDFETLAAELAAEFAKTSAQNDRTGELPRANLQLAAERGAPALTVPAELGGMGADLHQFARYQERLARGDGATALILTMHHMLVGGEAEARLWPPESFAEVCRVVREDGGLINSSSTEPGAGSPSMGGLPKTVAEPEDGSSGGASLSRWRITGRKSFTTGAPALAFMRVSARVTPDRGEPYAARFLVRLPAEGVAIEAGWDPAALKAAANDDVIFDRAPAVMLYREDQRGCEGNIWFQVAIAATYLGIGQAAYEAGRDYTRGRKAGGRDGTISDIESVRLRLGRSRGELMVARRNLFATCAEWVELPRARKEELVLSFSLAKVIAVNAAAAAAEHAVRLAGAAGLDRALPMERFLRETRAGLAHPPVDDVAYLALAREEFDGA
jgi:alkylation response protein AidB-like acyl-CoA dehydrogenase